MNEQEIRNEHLAWQNVVDMWPGDIYQAKKHNGLLGAIRLWGESLVTLRMVQSSNLRATALLQAINEFQGYRNYYQNSK